MSSRKTMRLPGSETVIFSRWSRKVSQGVHDGKLRCRHEGHSCPLLKVFQTAEETIYESGLGRGDKADLLTGMALLSGLLDKDLPRKLLERRRDIMMESYAYELIKKEGYEEGVLSGFQQGILQTTRELILDTLESRFEDIPGEVLRDLRKIENPDGLKLLFRKALRAQSLEDFQKALEKFLD